MTLEPQRPRAWDDQSPASLADVCVHCGHTEIAHTDPGHFFCSRCQFINEMRGVQIINPMHPFEPPVDPQRRYFRTDGPDSDRVGTLMPGSTFTLRLRDYTVKAPCNEADNGRWICLSHALNFDNNMDKDIHCWSIGKNQQHVLVWNCNHHGPESGGY